MTIPYALKEAPHLIAQRGTLLDEQLTGAMQRLDVLVFDFFNGYKAHVWPADRLTDGRGIIGIVLMALAGGRHKLGAHETDIMPQLAHRSRPVVGPLAGLHTDTTWGELRHKRQELRACQLLTDRHMPLRIYAVELKHVFCQIDPEGSSTANRGLRTIGQSGA